MCSASLRSGDVRPSAQHLVYINVCVRVRLPRVSSRPAWDPIRYSSGGRALCVFRVRVRVRVRVGVRVRVRVMAYVMPRRGFSSDANLLERTWSGWGLGWE